MNANQVSERRDWVGPTARFAPGAVFGAIVGFWMAVTINTPVLFFATMLACAIAGGLLSLRFGLRFWEAIRRLWWF